MMRGRGLVPRPDMTPALTNQGQALPTSTSYTTVLTTTNQLPLQQPNMARQSANAQPAKCVVTLGRWSCIQESGMEVFGIAPLVYKRWKRDDQRPELATKASGRTAQGYEKCSTGIQDTHLMGRLGVRGCACSRPLRSDTQPSTKPRSADIDQLLLRLSQQYILDFVHMAIQCSVPWWHSCTMVLRSFGEAISKIQLFLHQDHTRLQLLLTGLILF